MGSHTQLSGMEIVTCIEVCKFLYNKIFFPPKKIREKKKKPSDWICHKCGNFVVDLTSFWLANRFPEVAYLKYVCRLENNGRIETNMLSPKTTYGAYLVYKFAEQKQEKKLKMSAGST